MDGENRGNPPMHKMWKTAGMPQKSRVSFSFWEAFGEKIKFNFLLEFLDAGFFGLMKTSKIFV
jgi:hypothetical protein